MQVIFKNLLKRTFFIYMILLFMSSTFFSVSIYLITTIVGKPIDVTQIISIITTIALIILGIISFCLFLYFSHSFMCIYLEMKKRNISYY